MSRQPLRRLRFVVLILRYASYPIPLLSLIHLLLLPDIPAAVPLSVRAPSFRCRSALISFDLCALYRLFSLFNFISVITVTLCIACVPLLPALRLLC